MEHKIVVPALGESVTEATVAQWMKKPGEAVKQDEPIAALETDKITLEINAPASGVLKEQKVAEGGIVGVGDVLGFIDSEMKAVAKEEPKVAAEPKVAPAAAVAAPTASAVLSPSAQRLAAQNQVDPAQISGTGKDSRVMKGDVLAFIDKRKTGPAPEAASAPKPSVAPGERGEERVKMSRLRQRIAQRLKEAQNTAAMLTTFNEVDMSQVINLRNQLKESFEAKHGVKLGFMSFFVKAAIVALKEIPAVNAEIAGDEVIYKNYYDIGVAVGTDQGLVVPVVRDADHMSFADIEKTIGYLGKKAREGKLALEDLTGGTFTITNGGVYGSLMSTPIINPPQSGILGMHKTMERPIVVNGQIVARPMMYIALTYDHRIIDGKEAVTFLVRVKECIENPQRLLLDL